MRSLTGMPSSQACLAAPTVIVRTVVAMPEFIQLPSGARDFISSLYRPELLYITHAAPACARRATVFESRHALRRLRRDRKGSYWAISPAQRQSSWKAP